MSERPAPTTRPVPPLEQTVTTFITRYDTSGTGVRLAVKDLIDVAGEPTTAGCRAVAARAVPAAGDATCWRGPTAGARIVGRTNLHELALGVTGVNPWYGTPVNPLDSTHVPGGSSSGSGSRSPPARQTSPSAVTRAGRSASRPPAAARPG